VILDIVFVMLMFIGSTIFAIHPLISYDLEKNTDLDDKQSLLREKSILYKQIKELEMDYDLGNISKEDFEKTRLKLKKEVSQIFEKLSQD
jgi:hypothetical protein|tara:strand:- start:381 stop:650 length:270 start_codon:yes stop_codon:yes gene_type:complete